MIITIDGPAGSGKSTVAKLLAERLQLRFLDTGAMYRAVALAVLQARIDESDAEAVAAVAAGVTMEFQDLKLILNGQDVSQAIRSPEVTAVSSIIASIPGVRSRLVNLQQQIGQRGGLVTEGRDQGTIVFPRADYKFFVTASVESRARRRQLELASRGSTLPLSAVRDQLVQRDDRDEQRIHAPMIPAADAVILDTSDLTIGQVVEAMIRRIHSHQAPRMD